MAKHHYHVIDSEYGDPFGMSLRTLKDVRKGIQDVLRDIDRELFDITGDGSGLWYRITARQANPSRGAVLGEVNFISFDDCTDDDCPVPQYFN